MNKYNEQNRISEFSKRENVLHRTIKGLDLESSDESCPDLEDDESKSGEEYLPGQVCDKDKLTTSWEDMSKLDPNLLLYKASGARNLPVMVEALSNRADPNWVNMEEDGKTPIMKAVQTVSWLFNLCEQCFQFSEFW